jgi:hypothetical protein
LYKCFSVAQKHVVVVTFGRIVAMDYITPKEVAERWGISERIVEALCANGQIDWVERLGGKMWIIPKSASKPIDGRTKAAKEKNERIFDSGEYIKAKTR